MRGETNLDQFPRKDNVQPRKDKIDGNSIILDGEGHFPKMLIIILDCGKRREYRIVKTKNGGFILN
jgi:hypothetical protein